MKYFAILVGACLALTGCVVETNGSGGAGVGGAGGTGGSGASGGTGATGGSVGGGGSGATGGGGSGTGGAACVGCGEYITTDDPAAVLCDGASTDLYDALAECTCAGACADTCMDSVCAQMDLTTECQTCVTDTAAGCGTFFNDCANDI